jgi:hypothetical protein
LKIVNNSGIMSKGTREEGSLELPKNESAATPLNALDQF